MLEGVGPPNGDMRLGERRALWRSEAGKVVANAGRLASRVTIREDGEIIPIFRVKGAFRFTLDGRVYRLGHLGDAELIALGWLFHSEGR